MDLDIRPPLITGSTVEEQVMQIIRYLIRLVSKLRELPENAPERTVVVTEPQLGRNSVQKLTIGKDLRVGNDVAVVHDLLVGNDVRLMKGGVNGVYMQTVELVGKQSFRLKCAFDKWEEIGLRQSFFISGCMSDKPFLGVLRVNDAGRCLWSGSEGITATPEADGWIQVKLPNAVNDHFLIQSPEYFSL